MMITDTTLATGPCSDSKIWLSSDLGSADVKSPVSGFRDRGAVDHGARLPQL